MANRNDKRARKKSHRDAVVQQQWAAYRRRRFVRWTAIGVIVLLIGGAVVFAAGDDEKDDGNDRSNVAASQDPTEPTEPTEPSEEPSAPEEPTVPTEAACGAEPPPKADPGQYKKPEQVTEDGVDYGAVIKTSCGDITVDLLEESTPETVNSFVFLSKEGYFDGLIFHRIVPDFVIQAGDPNGLNGQEPDGPGYSIPDELPTKSNGYRFGALAMANAGPGTGGSQFFFVVHAPETGNPAGLQPDYAIFGEASKDSEETLLEIAKQKTFGGTNPAMAEMPKASVYIESIEITEN